MWKRVDKDGLNDAAVIGHLVRKHGAEYVAQVIHRESMGVEEIESKLNRPESFRFFTRDDWFGFAGAERFVDGVRPLYGQIPLFAKDGVRQQGGVVVGADEDGVKALVELHVGDDSEDIFHFTFPSVVLALANLQLLISAKHPVTIKQLVALGWEKIN